MTSHAAVVARGWGKCCVSGCSDIRVSETNKVNPIPLLIKLVIYVGWMIGA
jgi:phosphoenolpyruvate synthase/pyruvate phosphate dikinase